MGGNKVARVGAAGGCSGAGGRGWVHLRCVRPGVVTADCTTYNGPPPAQPGGLPVLWPWTVTSNSGPLARQPDSDRGWPGPAGPGCSVLYLIRHWRSLLPVSQPDRGARRVGYRPGAKVPGRVQTDAALREGSCLAANAKCRPVGPTEKHFDPVALARSLELASYRL